MIFDSIDCLQNYASQHPGLEAAGCFLKRHDLHQLPEGRHEINGDDFFALVSVCEGKGRRKAKLEAHRKYVDVQFCLSGQDLIGIRPVSECATVLSGYDATKDIMFFKDPVREWIILQKQQCAVFFPEDAHAPLAGTGMCKKIVLKIKVKNTPADLQPFRLLNLRADIDEN